VARKLLEEKASLAVSDPKALANARVDLAGLEGVEFIEEPSEAARGAHAVAIMTKWEMVRGLDWVRIYASMEKPAFLFDGRNLLNHKRMYEIGFNVYPLGGPALRHF
jgi:UDPglucose 6-dehydrogenase